MGLKINYLESSRLDKSITIQTSKNIFCSEGRMTNGIFHESRIGKDRFVREGSFQYLGVRFLFTRNRSMGLPMIAELLRTVNYRNLRKGSIRSCNNSITLWATYSQFRKSIRLHCDKMKGSCSHEYGKVLSKEVG